MNKSGINGYKFQVYSKLVALFFFNPCLVSNFFKIIYALKKIFLQLVAHA